VNESPARFVGAPVLEIQSVSKAFGGLRPLRIERLQVGAGDNVALVGVDQPGAETFVNLATGAMLPDSGGVLLFGRPTASIENSDEWLAAVDRVGIVSDRAVLLEDFSVVQNLAIPFSLDIEPPPPDILDRVCRLATEVALPADTWDAPVRDLDPVSLLRVRIGRALALDPDLVLLEHPNAHVQARDIVSTGGAVRAILERRGRASITLTADARFAGAVASIVLQLEPATGRLSKPRRGWFGARSR